MGQVYAVPAAASSASQATEQAGGHTSSAVGLFVMGNLYISSLLDLVDIHLKIFMKMLMRQEI